jgi:hypothetical protein
MIFMREIYHYPAQPKLKQKIGFTPPESADLVVATANGSIFSPLAQIAASYGWDFAKLKTASKKCNKNKSLAFIHQNPLLVLVPKTNGDSDATPTINELANAIRENNVNLIHFTHYGFLQSFPTQEIVTFITAINKLKFDKTVAYCIDINSKFADNMTEMIDFYSQS